MITSTDRGALRHQEMSAGRCVIDIGIYLGRERALDVTIHQRLNGARQLRRPRGQRILCNRTDGRGLVLQSLVVIEGDVSGGVGLLFSRGV